MQEQERIEILQRHLTSQLRWLVLSSWFTKGTIIPFVTACVLLLIGNPKWEPTLIVTVGMWIAAIYCYLAAGRAIPEDKR
jgi:hypothetical protein